MVVSDDPEVCGLDLDAVGLDPDADVGLDADGRGVYTFSNWNDGWRGIEDDNCDGKYEVDPDLDPDGRCAVNDDCIGKYREADEDEEHKGGRQGKHFLLSLLVCTVVVVVFCSAFGLKYASPADNI